MEIFKLMIHGKSAGARVIDGRARTNIAILAVLVIVTFLLGGASRSDVLSLVVLRPFSAVMLVLAVFLGAVAAWKYQWQILALAGAVVLLTVSHLIPLPPAVWTGLPGREVVVKVFAATGQPLPWLPLSMAPLTTWNALFALMGPMAALLLAFAVPEESRPILLKLVLAIGIVSALFGLLQVIGPMKGPLYFYRITNNGTAVGLFANRNHQAVFLATLFPLLAAYAALQDGPHKERNRMRRIMAAAVALFLVPLLLVTGSRAGFLLGALGLVSCFWVYRPATGSIAEIAGQWKSKKVGLALAGGGLALAGLAAVFAIRAPAFQRLVELDTISDMRFRALPTIWQAVWSYFPAGSGIGSFVEAYKVVEPQKLLSPNYLNHAHNDVLEVAMVGGLPAMLLMFLAALLLVVALFRLARVKFAIDRPRLDERDRLIVIGRAALVALLILAIGSFADYPLRAPSLAVVLMVYVALGVSGWKAAATPPRVRS